MKTFEDESRARDTCHIEGKSTRNAFKNALRISHTRLWAHILSAMITKPIFENAGGAVLVGSEVLTSSRQDRENGEALSWYAERS